jgi:hypothetical protein
MTCGVAWRFPGPEKSLRISGQYVRFPAKNKAAAWQMNLRVAAQTARPHRATGRPNGLTSRRNVLILFREQ